MSNKDRGAFPSLRTVECCPGLSKLEYITIQSMCALLSADIDGRYDDVRCASLYKRAKRHALNLLEELDDETQN